MTPFNSFAPARAAAVLAVASTLTAMLLPTAVQAATIGGGGSLVLAVSHRQAANCYGVDINTLPLLGGPTVIPFSNFPGCVSPSTNEVRYLATQQGVETAAVLSHDPAFYGTNASIPTWPNSVQYGLTETALLDPDVNVYNNGGSLQGVTLTATPSGPNQYPLPKPLYGALVQFPLAVAPIALAYDPVYKKVNVGGVITTYRLNVNSAFARSNGGLRLNASAYCKILNGQITDWNDAAITALNGGVSLKDPADPATFSAPIELVGQGARSGATKIATRHLAAACAGVPGNNFTDAQGTSTLPVALQGSGPPAIGKFTLVNGLHTAAAYASFSSVPTPGATLVQSRLTYVTPEYTLPNTVGSGLPYTLYTADLQNAAGAYRAPTPANTSPAFSNAVPSLALRANPAEWVRTGALANPPAASAYPIIGTVNFIGYTCYATAATTDTLRTPPGGSSPGYLNYWLDSTTVDGPGGILATAGLAALPLSWQTAIKATFLVPDATTMPLNLFISTAGPGATNSACAAAGVIGA